MKKNKPHFARREPSRTRRPHSSMFQPLDTPKSGLVLQWGKNSDCLASVQKKANPGTSKPNSNEAQKLLLGDKTRMLSKK